MADEKAPEKASAGSSGARATAKAAQASDWKKHLDESNAWVALTQDVDMRYSDDGFEGPQDGSLDRVTAGRIYSVAVNVLGAHGYKIVDGAHDPSLSGRVAEA